MSLDSEKEAENWF